MVAFWHADVEEIDNQMRAFSLIIFGLLVVSTLSKASTAQPVPFVDQNARLEKRVQHFLDREEIAHAIVNDGLSFGAKDWDLRRPVFAGEVEMDFPASIGEGLVTMHVDEWIKAVRLFFTNLRVSQHIAMPLTIEIGSDEAYVRSMPHAQHYLPNDQCDAVQVMGGSYNNWLIRTSEGWKIRKMLQHITWNEGNWYVFEKAEGAVD